MGVLRELVLSVIGISYNITLIPVSEPERAAVLSEAWFCGQSLAGIAVSNPAGSCLSLVIDVCCQVEVSATGRSLVKRSPTECDVSECDSETPKFRRPKPTRAVER